MSSEKKIHCSIPDYIENRHPDVYKAIKELCLFSSLKPRRGNSIALVLPDKKVLDTILKDVFSDKEEEVQSALDTMKAHILVSENPIKNVNDLKTGVSNRLGKVFNLADAKLSVDSGFRMLNKTDSMAVFKADGPMPPGTVDAPKMVPGAGRKSKTVTGSAQYNGTDRARELLAHFVRESLGQGKNRGVFVRSVISLMRFLKTHEPYYSRALATLDPSPIASFYLLVEPYKEEHDDKFIISQNVLDEWIADDFGKLKESINSIKLDEAVFNEYVGLLKEGRNIFNDGVRNTVDSHRWTIIEGGISKKTVPGNIKKAYTEVAQLYKSGLDLGPLVDPSFKEWQDVARYHINYMYQYLDDPFAGHEHSEGDFIATVKAILGGDKKFSVLSNELMSTDDFLAGPISFVYSGSFMYFPNIKSTTGAGETDGSGDTPSDDLPPGVVQAAGMGTGDIEIVKGSCGSCGGVKT